MLWDGVCSQSHDISPVWSLQAMSHSRCIVIGCVCILIGALAFQHQDVQAFLGIALPGSFTDKPDIVRHISDSCTCLAADTNPASCLLLALCIVGFKAPATIRGLTCYGTLPECEGLPTSQAAACCTVEVATGRAPQRLAAASHGVALSPRQDPSAIFCNCRPVFSAWLPRHVADHHSKGHCMARHCRCHQNHCNLTLACTHSEQCLAVGAHQLLQPFWQP